ncbi:DUF881 domain-containing protein [Brevibacterium litoralis]|uniref:DUF881 domain-containing protein n=1 Tax=Brevibacterium litoralis TaxID=3138935 RepID=UPI0032EF98D7
MTTPRGPEDETRATPTAAEASSPEQSPVAGRPATGGPGEESPAEHSAAEENLAEGIAAEVDPAQVGPAEVGPGEGASGAESAVPARGRREESRRRERREPVGPTPEPEDAGTKKDARARLWTVLTVGHPRSQVLAGALCLVLGFALVAQIRQTEDSGLEQLSEQELLRILEDVDSRSERLQEEAEGLEADERDLESGSDQRAAAIAQSEERAQALAVLAGTVPVTGPGVEIRVGGGDEGPALTAATAVTLVQELRDAGAEAIAFGDVRVVVQTAFTEDREGTLRADGQALPGVVTVTAIGEPETLSVAMNIPGGVADTVRSRGGVFEVETRESVDIDAVVDADTP